MGNRPEQVVAGAVARSVVELLETVEVEQGDGQAGAAAPGPLDLQRKLLLPAPPVTDAGERVGARFGPQPVDQLVDVLDQRRRRGRSEVRRVLAGYSTSSQPSPASTLSATRA